MTSFPRRLGALYPGYRKARKAAVDMAAFLALSPWIALRQRRAAREPRRLLLVALLKIGDTLTTLPTAEALRRRFPKARIGLWCRPDPLPLVAGHPAVDRTFAGTGLHTMAALRRWKADLAVVCSFRPQDLFLARLIGAKALAGYDHKGRGRAVDIAARAPRHIGLPVWEYRPGERILHQVEIVHRLAEALGAPPAPPDPVLSADPALVEDAKTIWPEGPGPRILLHPWNGQRHYRWPQGRWVRLAQRLGDELSARMLLTQGSADRAEARSLARAIDRPAHLEAVPGEWDLKRTAAAVSTSDLVVSVDTMTPHLAAAIGRPVVALFGPGSPRVWGPRGNGHKILQDMTVCHGCRQPACHRPTHECMEGISVEEVFEATRTILVRQGSGVRGQGSEREHPSPLIHHPCIMRILYISTEPVPAPHGGSVHTWEVARGLSRRGHAVSLVCPASGGRPEEETLEGIRILRRPMRLLGKSFPLRLALSAPLLSRQGYDAVLSRASALGGADLLLARLRRVPLVLEINNPHAEEMILRHRLGPAAAAALRAWSAWTGSRADGAVTPNARIAPKCPKALELPWGADTEAFHPSLRDNGTRERIRRDLDLGDRPTALFTGTFRAWHGAALIPEIAQRALAKVPDAIFLLAGDGDTAESVRDQIDRRGLSRSVRLLGSLPYERMPKICAAADVGVAPFEPAANPLFARFGFYYSPLKIFEYMAAGLPTVTFDIPELARIVGDLSEGRTAPVGDVEAFAGAVGDLLSDRSARKEMGARARAKAERLYSWSAHAEQLEKFLILLASSGAPRS